MTENDMRHGIKNASVNEHDRLKTDALCSSFSYILSNRVYVAKKTKDSGKTISRYANKQRKRENYPQCRRRVGLLGMGSPLPTMVNEDQLRLGRKRQVWFIPLVDECGVGR